MTTITQAEILTGIALLPDGSEGAALPRLLNVSSLCYSPDAFCLLVAMPLVRSLPLHPSARACPSAPPIRPSAIPSSPPIRPSAIPSATLPCRVRPLPLSPAPCACPSPATHIHPTAASSFPRRSVLPCPVAIIRRSRPPCLSLYLRASTEASPLHTLLIEERKYAQNGHIEQEHRPYTYRSLLNDVSLLCFCAFCGSPLASHRSHLSKSGVNTELISGSFILSLVTRATPVSMRFSTG